jgi:hypothetical protein
MATLRFQALKEILNRNPIEIVENERRSELFGRNVFTESVMRQFLTKEAYQSVKDANATGKKIDRTIADHISTGMKSGPSPKVLLITPTGSSLLPEVQPKSMMLFLKLLEMALPLKNLVADNLYNRNPMLPVFPMVE